MTVLSDTCEHILSFLKKGQGGDPMEGGACWSRVWFSDCCEAGRVTTGIKRYVLSEDRGMNNKSSVDPTKVTRLPPSLPAGSIGGELSRILILLSNLFNMQHH